MDTDKLQHMLLQLPDCGLLWAGIPGGRTNRQLNLRSKEQLELMKELGGRAVVRPVLPYSGAKMP